MGCCWKKEGEEEKLVPGDERTRYDRRNSLKSMAEHKPPYAGKEPPQGELRQDVQTTKRKEVGMQEERGLHGHGPEMDESMPNEGGGGKKLQDKEERDMGGRGERPEKKTWDGEEKREAPQKPFVPEPLKKEEVESMPTGEPVPIKKPYEPPIKKGNVPEPLKKEEVESMPTGEPRPILKEPLIMKGDNQLESMPTVEPLPILKDQPDNLSLREPEKEEESLPTHNNHINQHEHDQREHNEEKKRPNQPNQPLETMHTKKEDKALESLPHKELESDPFGVTPQHDAPPQNTTHTTHPVEHHEEPFPEGEVLESLPPQDEQ